jgi:hypothetical protein
VNNLEEVTFYGLYYGLCASRRRIPQQAAMKANALPGRLRSRLFRYSRPGNRFCRFLGRIELLADQPCPGCRAGGGNPGCGIRTCARERWVVACPLCAGYPCGRLNILENYPLRSADGQRMQVIGIEQWAAEQEARARRGLAYADVRFPEKT